MPTKFCRNLLRKKNALSYKLLMHLGTNKEEQFEYQKTIAKHLEVPLTTLSHHVTKLKREGLIGKGLELTPKGEKLFYDLWKNVDREVLRAHNIQIKFILKKCPLNYLELYSDKIVQDMSNGKYNGFKSYINIGTRITLMLYSRKKIICTLKDIIAETDEEISSTIQLISGELKEKIEFEFPGIEISTSEYARIQCSHIAFQEVVLAKNIYLGGFTYEGREIAIDKSHGVYEVELTNPKNNLRNVEKLRNFLEKLEEENQN